MPMYDRHCADCGTTRLDCWEPVTCDAPLCYLCLTPMDRVFTGKASNVIGDECEITQENGFRHPRRFTSKIERRRALKEAGLQEVVKNAGPDDKHCRPWVAMDAHTLENARILVSRNGTARATTAAPEKLHISFVAGEGIG